MKFKYYLRGLGIGIIITTIVFMIAYSGHRTELTDAEIIARAEALGMVMKDEPLFSNTESDQNTEVIVESEVTENTELFVEQETQNETETEVETEVATELETETETEIPTETETESETAATGETYRLVIPTGSVPRLICNELEEQGVIESSSELRQYLVDVGYATSIIVGEYDIPYGATKEEVYQILKAGPL